MNTNGSRRTSMGVRNRDIAALSGLKANAVSNASRRGRFTKLPDGTYHTGEVDLWLQTTIDPSLRVPNHQRGYLFADDLDAPGDDDDSVGTDATAQNLLRSKVARLHQRVKIMVHDLNEQRAAHVPSAEMQAYFATTQRICRDAIMRACEVAPPGVVKIQRAFRELDDGTRAIKFIHGNTLGGTIFRQARAHMEDTFVKMDGPLKAAAAVFSPRPQTELPEPRGSLKERFKQLQAIDNDLSAEKMQLRVDIETRALLEARVPRQYHDLFERMRHNIERIGDNAALEDATDPQDIERILKRAANVALDHFERLAGELLDALLRGDEATVNWESI